MTDDIVNDLRKSKWNENFDTNVALCEDAANEIELLREQNEYLQSVVNSLLAESRQAIHGIEDMYKDD